MSCLRSILVGTGSKATLGPRGVEHAIKLVAKCLMAGLL